MHSYKHYHWYNYIILVAALSLNGLGCGKVTYVPGPQGAVGATGSQGPTGSQGDIGPTGEQGPQGSTGATGPQGPQGEAGTPGTNGSSCSVVQSNTGASIQCTNGSIATISNGNPGEQGVAGPQGSPGKDASPCTTKSTSSGVTIVCPDGSSSFIRNDTDSNSGTMVVPIQFCPSYGSTVYPTTFPEFGFCIEGSLYAVYWNGTNAFMAQVVDGRYVSTSPDTCTFKVSNGCTITEE